MQEHKKIVFKYLIIFSMLIIACVTIKYSYSRYVLHKSTTITITSLPLYFEAETDNTSLELSNNQATLNLTVANNDETHYNDEQITYQISLEGNDKFNFTVDNISPINGVIEKTLSGSSLINDILNLNIIPESNTILGSLETATLKIKAIAPYEKEITIPISILPQEIQGRLPAEYQEVEYIESTGTQYIDTEIIPETRGYSVELDVQLTSNANNHWIFGIDTSFEAGIWSSDLYTGAGFKYSTQEITSRMLVRGTNNNTSSKSMYLCARNWENEYGMANVKVYSCKIYDNMSNLIQDLVPCYRKSDEKVGMYDLVTGKFLTSATGTQFNKGQNAIIGDLQFENIEYIEGTGTQYIDTRIIPDKAGYKVEVDFQLTAITSMEKYICGINATFEAGTVSSQLYTNGRFSYSKTNKLDRMIATGTTAGGFNESIFLLARNLKNNKLPASAKIYECKIYDNQSNLLLDLIPVYCTTTDEVGMKDTITGKFFRNSGTGEFEAGPTI